MKRIMIKYIIPLLIIICDCIALYMMGGYIYRGASGAILKGAHNAYFVGYYMLAAFFLLIVIAITVGLFFYIKYIYNKVN